MDKELINFKDWLNEQLKDPEFKAAYDALEPKYEVIRAVLRKRIEQNMSQKDLAKKLKTNQSAVSRLESGRYNPSLKFLQKVAKALGGTLKITIV